MLSQSATANVQHSLDIESLMDNDLRQTIRYHIKKYGASFDRKLGLTEDDLRNDIREQVWKGLISFKPDGRATLKTFLNKLISNRFKTLLRKSSTNKYSSVDYYADVFTSGVSKEYLETDETGETIFERRQEFMIGLASLTETDRKIFLDLITGHNLKELEDRHGLPRYEITAAINRINDLNNKRRAAA